MALRGARRGRFGRLPSAAPDLTNTIVSIAREMARQQDQNIMDAWQKGGTFEGKPATDEMVLAHWRQRLAGVDKNDPLHDTYSNSVLQLDYSIHESKASTLYAQGKINDKQMASFYLTWAKKVPKNSEFWRTLQRDGAQFMRASSAKGRAAAKAAAEKAYQDGQTATANKYEKSGQYITDVINHLSQSNALIGIKDDVRSFDPSDPSAILKLIGAINGSTTDPKTGKPGTVSVSSGVLYHDPITGKPVTGADILAKLKSLDPSFTGQFSLSYYSKALRQQLTGQGIRLKSATSTGHAGDANNIQKWQQYTSEIGREANAWPIEDHYQIIRSQFLDTWQSKTASPEAKLAAWNVYRQGLIDTANSTKNVPDDNTKARLLAEANGNGSIDSMAETFTGLNSHDHTTTGTGMTGDIAETAAQVALYQGWHDAAASGQGFWAQGTLKDGVFTPGAGTQIGLTTVQPPSDAMRVFLPQGNGQPPIPVYVVGQPVDVTVVDQDGFGVSSTTPNQKQVATSYDVVINGQVKRMYSYTSSSGQQLYTQDPPWGHGANVSVASDGTGVHVTVTIPTPTAANTAGNPNFSPVVNASTGAVTGYTVNPAAIVIDPVRQKAGPDPIFDSFSPTLNLLASMPDGAQTLASLSTRKDFLDQITNEAQRAAGGHYDPTTNTWTGADPNKLAQYQSQASFLTHIQDHGADMSAFLAGAFKTFNRATTTGTFAAVPAAPIVNTSTGFTTGQSAALPADRLGDTAFHALGSVFAPGTTNILPGDTRSEGTQIKLAGAITTPSVPSTTPLAPAGEYTTPSLATILPNPTVPPPPAGGTVTQVAPPSTGSPNVNPSTGFTVPPPPPSSGGGGTHKAL